MQALSWVLELPLSHLGKFLSIQKTKQHETERQFSWRIANGEWQSVGGHFASLFKSII